MGQPADIGEPRSSEEIKVERDQDIHVGDNRTTTQHCLQEEVALIDRDGDIEEERGTA